MHRRKQHPSDAGRGRSGKKGGRAEPSDHALGRSRGGFGTKVHIVTDGQGLPLAVTVTAGQRHESTQFEVVMQAGKQRRGSWPQALAGDKGYSYPRIRAWLEHEHVLAVIPRRSDQRLREPRAPFDRARYRQRNVVERCIGWLKEHRRICTRFEKLATSFLAMLKLAMVLRYLRVACESA